MAISNVRSLGSNSASSATPTLTSLAIALSGAAAIGDLVVVPYGAYDAGTPAAPTGSDSAGNSYTRVQSNNNSGFLYAYLTHALASSDTVTLTFAGSYGIAAGVFAASGASGAPVGGSAANPFVGPGNANTYSTAMGAGAAFSSSQASALTVASCYADVFGSGTTTIAFSGASSALSAALTPASGLSDGWTAGTHVGSGTSFAVIGTVSRTYQMGSISVIAFGSANLAPNAPTLTAKSAFDVHLSTTFQWTFSDPDYDAVAHTGDTQAYYELLITRHDTGATIYDSGKVAGTTTVTNQLFTATLPANSLSIASIQYDWTVKTWDPGGLVGPYAAVGSFTPFAGPSAPTLSATGSFNIAQAHTFGWQYNNTADPGNTASAYQLQITTLSGGVVFDTGKVLSTANTYTLAANTLPSGGSYKWTVRTWDQHDNAGPYATAQTFTAAGPPTATITQPTPAEVVTQSALTVVWTYGGLLPQGAYQLRLLQASVPIYNSGEVTSTATQATLPALSDASSYQVGLTVWDNTNTAGAETLVSFSTAFVQTPTPLLSLVATATDGSTISLTATAPTPQGAQVAADHFEIWRSNDNGATWTRVAQSLAPQ